MVTRLVTGSLSATTAAAVTVALAVSPVTGTDPARAAVDRSPTATAPVSAGAPRSSKRTVLGPSRGRVRVLAASPDVPVGTGPARNATFASFTISRWVRLRVNAGSGNALVRTTDLVLPGIGSNVTLGAAYNSLLVGSGVPEARSGRGGGPGPVSTSASTRATMGR